MLTTFLILAGLILGLGSVTVIDLHGFLGRKSAYWTEATTRTHKVTKALIWVGTILLLIGELLLFYPNYTNPAALTFFGILTILILNGLFLTFSVSPFLLKREEQGKQKELLPKKWQIKITISFIISFIGWWSTVALFAFYFSYGVHVLSGS